MAESELCGIICVNKPQEFTSFDVVAIAKKAAGTRKIGHGGTLDPMATGVLPLFVGRAAKLSDLVPDTVKQYKASFMLGACSDTEDVWGEVTKLPYRKISRAELECTIAGFIGEIEQIPPMYSAVKVNGRRLYSIARTGAEIERPARKITVYGITLLDYDEDTLNGQLLIDCSKGTYIRTLIADIGKRLNSGGIMTALVRTRSAGFTLNDCIDIDTLRALTPSEVGGRLIPSESLFINSPEYVLDDAKRRLFLNGTVPNKLVEDAGGLDKGMIRIKDACGKFLGLAYNDGQGNVQTAYLEFTDRH